MSVLTVSVAFSCSFQYIDVLHYEVLTFGYYQVILECKFLNDFIETQSDLLAWLSGVNPVNPGPLGIVAAGFFIGQIAFLETFQEKKVNYWGLEPVCSTHLVCNCLFVCA